MTKHLPPVPPQNQSDKGPGGHNDVETGAPKPDDTQRNYSGQGRQGNIKQNTTHQGYQQDR